MSAVRSSVLLDDVVLIEHSDAGTAAANMAIDTYAVLGDGRSLIVDASFTHLLPAIEAIDADGHPPAALVLTHRHLVGDRGFFRTMVERYGVPVLMHPIDIAHPSAGRSGTPFENVMTSPVLREFGFEPLLFPGQTEGSVVLYRDRDRLLLAGDSAMGPTIDQAAAGKRLMIRPPFWTNVDDAAQRRNWERFNRPVEHLAAFHGAVALNIGDEWPDQLSSLTRPEPTLDLLGTPGPAPDVALRRR